MAGYILKHDTFWGISLGVGQNLYVRRIPDVWTRGARYGRLLDFAQVETLANGIIEISATEPIVLVVLEFNRTGNYNDASDVLFIRNDRENEPRMGTLVFVSYVVWRRAEGHIDHLMTRELCGGRFAPALLYSSEIQSYVNPPNERELHRRHRPWKV